MASIVSLEENYNFNAQTLRSTAKLRLTDSLKASCYVITPSDNVAGVELEGNDWSVAHHAGSMDWMFKLKRSVGANTKLTLSQHVPGSKWFLAPNPAIKIAHKGLAGRHSLLEGSWDTLTRSGATSMTVYGGEDKAYKAEVALHSHKGVVAKGRAKIRQGLVHSIAASAGSKVGPMLSLKSRIGEGSKVKTSFDVAAQVVKVHAKHMGVKPEGGPAPQALLDVVMPLGKGPTSPIVTVGMKWHF